MQPKPLLRILSYPSFNGPGNHLRSGGDVDLAVRLARQLQPIGKLEPEASVGQAHGSPATNRIVELARQPRRRRVHLAPPTEEEHIDSPSKVLVHENCDA